MKTKEFFMRDEEYARMKAVLLLLAIVFATGLVTNSFGVEVGRMYIVAIFGSFAVISIGLLYHYREEPEENESVEKEEDSGNEESSDEDDEDESEQAEDKEE